jgi:hypothetical protein
MPRRKLSEYVKPIDEETSNSVDEVGKVKEEEKTDSPFLPSLFTQFDTPGSEPSTRPTLAAETPEEQIVLDPEDIEILVELPFDAASQITKWPGWSLSTKETKALTRLWIKPFREWLKDVDNMPLYLASITTLAIVGEKFLGYKAEQQQRTRASVLDNSTGDAGLRKN